MKTKVLILSILLTLSIESDARVLPTWHSAGNHHHAMLVAPPSEVPVTVKVVDAQQNVLLLLTLDATQGVQERMNFTWMPTGRYVLEVQFEQETYYKTLLVQDDRVRVSDSTKELQTTPYSKF